MVRKQKSSLNRHLKIKINGTNRTRTLFNYFKNVNQHKEHLIAKALSTEKWRLSLAMAMAMAMATPIREELQKQRFMRGF